MKKDFKFLSMLFFTVLYCFIIGAVNNVALNHNYESQQEVKKVSFAVADIANISNYDSENSENFVDSNSNLTLKKPLQHYLAIQKTLYDNLSVEFTLYTSVLRKFTLKFQKTDIIFPFHFFW